MSKRITVPLALDAELQMSYPGLGNFPIRSIIASLIVAVPAIILIVAGGHLLGVFRFWIAAFLIVVALVVSLPKTDNIWIGTQWLYRRFDSLLITGSTRGILQRVTRSWTGGMLQTSGRKDHSGLNLPWLRDVIQLPQVTLVDDGLFATSPGGYAAVLTLRGPDAAIGSDGYAAWGESLTAWIRGLECPVQVYAVVDHYNSSEAERAFDDRLAPNIPRSPLLTGERRLVSRLADASFGVSTYLIIDPGLADEGGNPYGSWILDASSWPTTRVELVQEKANIALRTSRGFGIEAAMASKTEIEALLARTPLLAEQAVATEEAVVIKDGTTTFHLPNVVTSLPRSLGAGDLIDVLLQTHTKALVNLTIAPVNMKTARKKMERMIGTRNYAAEQKGTAAVEDSMVAAEGQALLELFAQGVRPVNMAISCSLVGDSLQEVQEAQERFTAHMGAKGFGVVHARQPGLWPMLACSPGGAPLKRSLIITIEPVTELLLPALGACFSNSHNALVGLNGFTGSPLYWDVWGDHGEANNHNMLMLATSGAGKSVTLKSMLYRHAIAGTNFCVLDPDSEYRKLLAGVGGDYYELGDDSLNAFAVVLHYSPGEAASMVLQVLAVLGGETAFDAAGQPIRRMKSEDKSWLHDQLTEFFEQIRFGNQTVMVEPTLQDFVNHLETRVQHRARNEQEAERARKIQERLSFYCKGKLASVFNRRSTFTLGNKPVGIGFKSLANEYAADLTPALAVVLTAIYSVLKQANQRFLIVVDEASYLTSNPDAGQVLEQIMRRGRKAGAGVWMASQKLEDFLDTPLGKTLASVSSTKWILGCQENTLNEVAEAFGLSAEEKSALNPIVKGRGVLLSDSGERAVTQLIASDQLLSIVASSPSVVGE